MKMYEYTKKKNFDELSPEQKIFTAKVIMNDVKKIAKEKGISEKDAYEAYSKGLYDKNIN